MKKVMLTMCVCGLMVAGTAWAGIPNYLPPVNIGVIPGSSDTVAMDININNEIVGYCTGDRDRGFLYLPAPNYGGAAGIHEIDAPVGGIGSGGNHARGINDNGMISGAVWDTYHSPSEQRFSTWEMSGGTFIWTNHGQGSAFRISNLGIMAARNQEPGTPYGFAVNAPGSLYNYLGGYMYRWGRDINNSDQTIVGSKVDTADAALWVYDPGQPPEEQYRGETILDKTGYGAATAYGINDNGDVVGFVDSDAALWSSGSYDSVTVLDSLGGTSVAYDINAAGLIVGSSNGKAVVWDQTGTVYDLDAMFPGVTLTEAVAINDDGNIAANGDSAYLILIPEPVTIGLLAMGSLALIRRRRA